MLKLFFHSSSRLKFECNDPLIRSENREKFQVFCANTAINFTLPRQLLNLPSLKFEEVGIHVEPDV